MKKPFSSLWSSRGTDKRPDQDLPWTDSQSIYDFIAQNIDPQTGKVSQKGQRLPDEERRFAGTHLRYAPGLVDMVIRNGATPEEAYWTAKEVSRQVLEIATTDSAKAKTALYKILVKDQILVLLDQAINDVSSGIRLPAPALHAFAVSLARTAPDRGPVKFAIALLGIFQDPADVDLVRLLSLHGEFSLYGAVTLCDLLPDPESELWSLAKKVNGWGKFHVLQQLKSTTSKEIKDWFLREGYRDLMMDAYLAHELAVHGGLRDALYEPQVDDALLQGAGEIISALLTSGPPDAIQGYTDAADVFLRYLELLDERASKINQYLVVDAILGYLTDEWDLNASPANGWTSEGRDRAIVFANQILGRPEWFGMVRRALQASDEGEFFVAAKAADLLGLETWELHVARLQEKPLDEGRWLAVMAKVDDQRIDQVIDLALKVLPLEQVATGPANELGLGPQYRDHNCLGIIVRDLDRFPGKGWSLIAASLKSPVVRNRNMALKAIEGWMHGSLPDSVREALVEAAKIEPHGDLRVRMQKMLQA